MSCWLAPRNIRLRLGALRDDVGRLTAARDDAMHAVGRLQALAQQTNRDLGDDQRVAGVDAALWKRGSVGALAVVDDLQLLGGKHRRLEQIGWAGMDHQRAVDALEGTLLQQTGSCRRRLPRPGCQ